MPLIVRDPILFQERQVLFLEISFLMVLLLLRDISGNGGHVRFAHAKCAVPGLPGKLHLPFRRTLLVGGITLLLAFGAPFLPIYTPKRARIFRRAKYILLAATFALVFGKNVLDWSWLLACSVWPLFWIEWTRTSIRRKLPEARWPKHLYL